MCYRYFRQKWEDLQRKDTLIKLTFVAVTIIIFIFGSPNNVRRTVRVNVSECLCSKLVELHKNHKNHSFVENTTCSKDVIAIGSHQKVLAFTLYQGATFDEMDRDYFDGIERNIFAMKELYPKDYRMRLYYHLPKQTGHFKRLCNLACNEPRLDICDVTTNPGFGDIR